MSVIVSMIGFLQRFKITSRIMFLVTLLLGILVVSQGVSLYQLRKARQEITVIAELDMPTITHLTEITKYQLEQAVSFQRAVRFGKFMIVNDAAKDSFYTAKNRFEKLGTMVREQFDATILFVDKMLVSAQGPGVNQHLTDVKTRLTAMQKDHQLYLLACSDVFKLILHSDYDLAEEYAQKIEQQQDTLNARLKSMLLDISQKSRESSLSANTREQLMQKLMMILAGVSVGFAVFFGVTISRSIIVPVRYGEQVAKDIARGKDDIQFKYIAKDEIGQLMVTMNHMFGTIKIKEAELKAANDFLEQRVFERTLELEDKNALLAQSNIELSRLHELKNEFLSIAAHDIRNPVAIIIGYTDLLKSETVTPPTPEQSRFLSKIKRSCKSIVDLINNLLDITTIESGQINLQRATVDDLKEFLRECYESNAVVAEAKSIRLALNVANQLPSVNIDKERINQVINNLVTNAIKFSQPNTTITIKASNGGESVKIAVADEGPGIPQAELPKLFVRHSRASTKPTAGERSTGLGLAIVKNIVEAHGCSVWVDSEVGKGSTFGFSLPVEKNTLAS